MRKITFILLLALSFGLTSCDWFHREELPTDVVLVYFAANNNLRPEASSDLEEIKKGWLPARGFDSQIYLVYMDSGGSPSLKRLSRDDEGKIIEEIVITYPEGTDSATKETLAQVLSDAEKAYPADTRGLVLWSHGSGFLPSGYYSSPTDPVIPDRNLMKSFGYDEGTYKEIEIQDVRTVLEKYHFRFLALDACLMGSIEVAYELRNVCDYILASPTESLDEGFPYEEMNDKFFDSANTETAIVECARIFYDYYFEKSSSGTIAVYKTSEIGGLTLVSKELFAKYNSEFLRMDRTKVQPFYRDGRAFFYDFGSTMEQLTSDQEYRQFMNALNNFVIYKAATANFLEIKIKSYSGIATYIPRAEYVNLNAYYRTLAWNSATGLVR